MYLGVHLDHYNYKDLYTFIQEVHQQKFSGLQVFLGDNHHTTLSKKDSFTPLQLKTIRTFLKKHDFHLYVHGVLTLNFCFPPTSPRFSWGIQNLVYDLQQCCKMGCKGVVIHMGSFQTPSIHISYQECLSHFVQSIHLALSQIKSKSCKIIFETPVQRPNMIGSTLESLAELYQAISPKDRKQIGFCIDTCHIFSSGYPIHTEHGMKTYFEEFDRLIGLQHLSLIHLNDSKEPFQSLKDRHESLGKGYIFSKKLGGDPKVLEIVMEVAKKYKIGVIFETNPKGFLRNRRMVQDYGMKKRGGKRDAKKKILSIFQEILKFHQTLGKKGNLQTKYRIQSYEKAIKSLQKHTSTITNISNVQNISGIGKGMQDKIEIILQTGTLPMYEDILKNPEYQAIYQFEQIWGIGVEKARDFVLKHHIYSIDELRKKVKSGEIQLNEQQLLGLEYYESLLERIPRKEIQSFTKYLQSKMKKYHINIQNAGSYRLGKTDSGDIDLLFVSSQFENHTSYAKFELIENILDDLRNENILLHLLSKGSRKIIAIIQNPKNGKIRQMDIMFIHPNELPWYLLYFGSSKDFSKMIRQEAIQKGYKLSEKGIFDRKTGKQIDFQPKTEKNIFSFLEIPYIPPSKRI